MKCKTILIILALSLQGCGDYVERNNEKFISEYKTICSQKGYDSLSVTYIGGFVSSYYSCFNQNISTGKQK